MTTDELIALFPPGVRLEIDVVFPSEYRIGYRYKGVHLSRGTPKYFPLDEALKQCYELFLERFPQDTQ